MQLRSAAGLPPLHLAVPLAALCASVVGAQSRPFDEGTFVITVGGRPAGTENFKIARGENGLITATGLMTEGTQQVSSALTTDSLGTPIRYDVSVRDKGVQTLKVAAAALGGRLTATSSNPRGDESMHEFRISAGHAVILEDGIVHQLYFLPLAKRVGSVETIAPRESHSGHLTVASLGLEPIQVAGRTLTATHYSVGDGATRREFWLDAAGRLLRAEEPARQLVATREDPPK